MTGVAVAGLGIAVLGLLAAAVAPKGSGSDDPDDDAVQGWTAVMFAGGCVLALAALVADGLAHSWGITGPLALTVVLGVVALMVGWCLLVRRLTWR